MSEQNQVAEQPVEDPVQKLKRLGEKREQLAARQARLQVVYEQAQAEQARLREEMKQHNTSPETIEADLAAAEAELAKETATCEQDLLEYDTILTNSEKALEAQ